jgi:hypothetical protein
MTDYTPHPMGAEEGQDYVIGYMCLTDFECELGMASGGNRVFPSVGDLKEHFKCVSGCGIAEVKVSFSRIIEPGKQLEGEQE